MPKTPKISTCGFLHIERAWPTPAARLIGLAPIVAAFRSQPTPGWDRGGHTGEAGNGLPC
jgi:hypothetical protein